MGRIILNYFEKENQLEIAGFSVSCLYFLPVLRWFLFLAIIDIRREKRVLVLTTQNPRLWKKN